MNVQHSAAAVSAAERMMRRMSRRARNMRESGACFGKRLLTNLVSAWTPDG
jgi:hypothetical protein